MRQAARAFALVALSATALVAPAFAKRAPPPAFPLRAARADAVVIGQVTAVSDKTEKADLLKGDKRSMTFATVKVTTALMGRPGATVKVGFVVPAPLKGSKRKLPLGARLTKGQQACLFLHKHPTKKSAYYLSAYYDVVDRNATNWKVGIEQVKVAARLLTDPMRGLKARVARERALTAMLLIHRYRSPSPGATKTEAVPAAESQLILTALTEADWDARPAGPTALTPQVAFSRLGLTPLDGWETPRDYAALTENAKKWLKANAGRYRMTRYVRDKLAPPPSEEPPP